MQLRGASQAFSRSTTFALGSMAAFLVIIIILFPDAAFQSSLQGLSLWWNLVFPALLPFLILTELLIGFGAVQGIGIMLEPLMRLLFRLPGVGGWALASGLIVGFPTGAKITASLREKELISRHEAQRLVNLTHLCSPLFLITIVGVGFLHQPRLGVLLAVVHYLAAILTGLFINRKKQNSQDKKTAASPVQSNALVLKDVPQQLARSKSISLWKRSIQTMRGAYLHDGRAFGKLLGDAVTTSVQTLMLIGGYMMIYSVMINVWNMAHLTSAIQWITSGILETLNLGPDIISQLLSGLFEIHLGAYSLAESHDVPLLWQMALLSALFGWGGLSAHAQVGGMIQHTDVRYLPFLMARCIHAAIAFVLTVILWIPLQLLLRNAEPSFLRLDPAVSAQTGPTLHAWHFWQPMLVEWGLILGSMLMLSLLLRRFQKRT
jgi:sporulation integral membrane protein YlbJ